MIWWWNKKEDKSKDPWAITVPEALEKYGSASKVLDEFCKTKARCWDPIVTLLLMERREKLEKKKKSKNLN